MGETPRGGEDNQEFIINLDQNIKSLEGNTKEVENLQNKIAKSERSIPTEEGGKFTLSKKEKEALKKIDFTISIKDSLGFNHDYRIMGEEENFEPLIKEVK